MNIKITPATEQEVDAFERKEWRVEDQNHYGKLVSWDDWNRVFFIFKAEKDGQIIGVIGGHHIQGVVFIERIILSNVERGNGIGKMLLEKAEEYSKGINAHKIYLYTGKDWEANNFYLKNGYEKTGELPNHFMKKDFVIYSKNI